MKQELNYKPLRWVVVFVVAVGLWAFRHLLAILAVGFVLLARLESGPWGLAERTRSGALHPELGGNAWMWVMAALICLYYYLIVGVRYGRRPQPPSE